MNYLNGIETKENILNVSKNLFFTKGFKETSIRQIAKKANVTSGALYKHFKNKEDILDAIISPYTDDFIKECEEFTVEFEKSLDKASTEDEIRNLMRREEAMGLYNYINKDVDIWKFILFKSTGTKYEEFFDKFIEYDTNITLKILKKLYPDKRYLELVSDIEIYFIIKGFYSTALNLFDPRFDEDKRVNYLKIVEDIYKSFWEKIFLLDTKRRFYE